MSNLLRTRSWMVAPLAALLLLSSPVAAQRVTDRAAPEDEAQEKPVRGRLPTFFSQVVTLKQRTEIYSIQAGYTAPVAQLKKQLQGLIDRRDAEVMKVLSPLQQQKVTMLREAARKRREARAAESREAVKPVDGSPGKPGSR
jgi:hypothetical protein